MQVSNYYEDLIKTTTSEIDKKEQSIKTSELLIFMNELKIKELKKQVSQYLQAWGISDIKHCNRTQRNMIDKLIGQSSSLRSSNTSIRNTIYSKHLSIFNAWLDISDYNNMKELANHLKA